MKHYLIFPILAILLNTNLFAQKDSIVTYFSNNKIKSVIMIKDSLREGTSRFYYQNGKIKEERPYKNGRVNGIVKKYNDNGNLKIMFTIQDGKREGTVSYFDSTGNFIKDIDFSFGKMIKYKIPFYADTNDIKYVSDKIKKIKPKQNALELPPLIKEDKLKDDPAYYLSVEVPPQPLGGMAVIYKKLRYPRKAAENNIEGIVKVLVFINKKGRVDKTKVIKGLGYGCDEAAQDAIKYTRFTPGLLRGKKVKVQLILSIKFKKH